MCCRRDFLKRFLESHGANAIRQAKERRHFHYVLSDSSFVCSCMFFSILFLIIFFDFVFDYLFGFVLIIFGIFF